MSNSRGIEIFIRSVSLDRLIAWLNEVAGPLGTATEAGDALVYSSRLGTVMVVSGPDLVSVWFNACDLPWSSHSVCARQAARALGCSVLCDPGAEYPDLDPLAPVLLEVDAAGECLGSCDG